MPEFEIAQIDLDLEPRFIFVEPDFALALFTGILEINLDGFGVVITADSNLASVHIQVDLQLFSLDLEMAADIRRAAETDAIEDTLNYKAVAKRLIQFVGDSEFQLVETLADLLVDALDGVSP